MLRDLRFALHLIVKDRWYSAVAIVALALGIGLNATVFTLVNAVLIRGLPFKDSRQPLHAQLAARSEAGGGSVSFADLEDWRGQTKTFAGLAGVQQRQRQHQRRHVGAAAGARAARHGQHVLACSVSRRSSAATSRPATIDNGRRDASRSSATRSGRRATAATRRARAIAPASTASRATIVGVMPEGMMFPTEHRDLGARSCPTEREQESRSDRDSCRCSAACSPDATRAQAQTEFERHRGAARRGLSRHEQGLDRRRDRRPSTSASTADRSASSFSR